MRLSKKQRQEIDYLSTHVASFVPTTEEVEEYIAVTVHGKEQESNPRQSPNRLFQAKRVLDISIACWKQDYGTLLFASDFEGEEHPYLTRILNSIKARR